MIKNINRIDKMDPSPKKKKPLQKSKIRTEQQRENRTTKRKRNSEEQTR